MPLPGEEDLATAPGDGGDTPGPDGGGGADLSGADLSGADLSGGGGADMTQGNGACIPGSYRCGPGTTVEICNSSGTAWLYSATCTVACQGGLCTGACSAGERRCNSNRVEECAAAGNQWNVVETCGTFCDTGRCALPSLDITQNRTLDGDVLVAGDVIVRSGVVVTAQSGDLTLRAGSIKVENGGSIAAAPKGQVADGQGGYYNSYSKAGGGGGGYGEAGKYDSGTYAPGGPAHGRTTDTVVTMGGKGGNGNSNYGAGGLGGGVLRLIASRGITIEGQVTANGVNGGVPQFSLYGGGGGGSGGGILLAAAEGITVSGSVSAGPGGGGNGAGGGYNGGSGGNGRVKILSGGPRALGAGVTGVLTQDLLPPMQITSSSHPNPRLTYNDSFPAVQFAWARPFSSRQGYFLLVNKSEAGPPTAATGQFVAGEDVTLASAALQTGENYFHIVPMDAMSNFGKVESTFKININSAPPALSSSSHPSESTWYQKPDAFFTWTFPVDESSVRGVYYVLDHYGETLPTTADTFLPTGQKQLLRSGLTSGIWVLHLIHQDQRGYLTKVARHYQVRIGTDPGNGAVLGQVVDGMGQKVDMATVTINRGLLSQPTNGTGNYNFAMVPAGTWELRASKGPKVTTQMITVQSGGSTQANLTLN